MAGAPIWLGTDHRLAGPNECGLPPNCAGSSADHPGQGVIYVQEISQEKAILSATIVITDEFDGKLEILAETPDGIILQSASGSQYFFNFDTYTLEVLN